MQSISIFRSTSSWGLRPKSPGFSRVGGIREDEGGEVVKKEFEPRPSLDTSRRPARLAATYQK